MSNKVDEKVFNRIVELKKIGLTDDVISIRLGISARTVRVYTRAARLKLKPYQKPDLHVQP